MGKWLNYVCKTEYLKEYFEESIKLHGKVKIKGVLEHVSESGMMRYISLFMPLLTDDGKPTIICLAREKKVTGCGMDMGFALAYDLFCEVYGSDEARPYQKYLDFSWL